MGSWASQEIPIREWRPWSIVAALFFGLELFKAGVEFKSFHLDLGRQVHGKGEELLLELGQQFFVDKRFCEVIIGSDIEAVDLILKARLPNDFVI